MPERWWILRGGFRWSPPDGGELYSGPYSSGDDAATARKKLEEVTGSMVLFIERQIIPEKHVCPACGEIHSLVPAGGENQ